MTMIITAGKFPTGQVVFTPGAIAQVPPGRGHQGPSASHVRATGVTWTNTTGSRTKPHWNTAFVCSPGT